MHNLFTRLLLEILSVKELGLIGVDIIIRCTSKKVWISFQLKCVRKMLKNEDVFSHFQIHTFDDYTTRQAHAASTLDVWRVLNVILDALYKPTDQLVIADQLFPFRRRTKFSQYMPYKPSPILYESVLIVQAMVIRSNGFCRKFSQNRLHNYPSSFVYNFDIFGLV